MKTFILVTPAYDNDKHKYSLNDFYTKAVLESGGIPIITPYENIDHVEDLLDNVSGIVLSGGGDIHAEFFNEELHEKADGLNVLRDEFEIKICQLALERDIPILAICRGLQILNVAMGGGLIQHIDGHYDANDDDLMHNGSVVEGTYFHSLFNENDFQVNSIHHQAIKDVRDNVEIQMYCGDIIEAIKVTDKKFVVGVQYHPERIYNSHCQSKILFDEFIKACKKDK